MAFSKKDKISEAPAPAGPAPYKIGLKGTAEALHDADKAAKADADAKKTAYEILRAENLKSM